MGGVDVYIHVSLISPIVGGEQSTSCPVRSTPGAKASGSNSTGGWVGPRAGLDDMEKRNVLKLRDSNSMKHLPEWTMSLPGFELGATRLGV
jgi:hypothetical protein